MTDARSTLQLTYDEVAWLSQVLETGTPAVLQGRDADAEAGRMSLQARANYAADEHAPADVPEALRALGSVVCAPTVAVLVEEERAGVLERLWLLGRDSFQVEAAPWSDDALELTLVDLAQRLTDQVGLEAEAGEPLQVRTTGRRLVDLVLTSDRGGDAAGSLSARGRVSDASAAFAEAYRTRTRSVQVRIHRLEGEAIVGGELAWIESTSHGLWTCPRFTEAPAADETVVLERWSSVRIREELLSYLQN